MFTVLAGKVTTELLKRVKKHPMIKYQKHLDQVAPIITKVKSGEGLVELAMETLGDPFDWTLLAEHNKIGAFDDIINKVVEIPVSFDPETIENLIKDETKDITWLI